MNWIQMANSRSVGRSIRVCVKIILNNSFSGNKSQFDISVICDLHLKFSLQSMWHLIKYTAKLGPLGFFKVRVFACYV
jgi:hypothetical protein